MNNINHQRSSRSSRRGVMILAVALLLAALAGLRPTAPALAACPGPVNVATAGAFLAAIDDFNDTTGPCHSEIHLTADIVLTDDVSIAVDNPDNNVTLDLFGHGHTIDFDQKGRGFHITAAGQIAISGLTLEYSRGTTFHIVSNRVLLRDVTVQSAMSGDGIYVGGGELFVRNSTISFNAHQGIHIDNEISSTTEVLVVNSTIAHNNEGISATSADVQITHATIARNFQAGLIIGPSGNATVHNSILSGSARDCQKLAGTVTLFNTLVEADTDPTCDLTHGVNDNIVGANPLLAPLGDYGGPTYTMPPLQLTAPTPAVSPVLDKGDNDLSKDSGETVQDDQRYETRFQGVGAVADMGAVEGALELACGQLLYQVSNETDLALALYCLDLMTTGGEFVIEFLDDIELTKTLHNIELYTPGLSLRIDGQGYTLTGIREADTFAVYGTETVTFEDLTITDSGLTGIYVNQVGLTVRRSTIKGNNGHGIRAEASNVTITDSTFSHNDQGGIYYETFYDPVELLIINSTFFDNAWDSYSAIYSESEGQVTIINSTIYRNESGLDSQGTDVTIHNSILAGSDGWDCNVEFASSTVRHSLVQFNDVFDPCNMTHGVDGNLVGVDPMLSEPGNYGGPMETVMPLQLTGRIKATSPVINAGRNDLAVDEGGASLSVDQRGSARKVGTVDMGAVEGTQSVNCGAFPRTVGNEAQLTNAILCYMGLTAPGVYAVNLSADVGLTASPPTIRNANPGVSLRINGNGRAIDGQGNINTRPLDIARNASVSLHDALITGGNQGENGGGIKNFGRLTIANSRLAHNTTYADGGGIFNDEYGTLFINNSVIDNNLAAYPDGDGGGIASGGASYLTDVVITQNVVDADFDGLGGGVKNDGVMVITRGTVTHNSLSVDNAYAFGGGVYSDANILIRDSIISDNTVWVANYYGFGGGVYADFNDADADPDEFGARAFFINTTISGNSAEAGAGALGGGLHVMGCCQDEAPPVKLINVTVADNSVDADDVAAGAGMFIDRENYDLDVTIHNTILADNLTGNSLGGDCVLSPASSGVFAFESRSSLYQDTADGACGLAQAAATPDSNGNYVGVDPLLGALGDNGGDTHTHELLAGSKAIDSGANALAVDQNGNPLAADQRGYMPRAAGGVVDMGAYETGAVPPPLFMSPKAAGTTDDNQSFDNSDILKWDGQAWSVWFDGSEQLLSPKKSKHNINAFWVPDPFGDDVVIAFAQNSRKVGDLPDKVDGNDLVWWDGNDWALWFDGSDVGLELKGPEKIDGLHVLPGSASPVGGACAHYLLLSTTGKGAVSTPDGTLRFSGEDMLGFCMTNVGAATAGFWHLAFDGSAAGLTPNSLDSISVDGDTLYFTSQKKIKINGVTYNSSTVYAYDINANLFTGPHFAPADEGLGGAVNGLHMN